MSDYTIYDTEGRVVGSAPSLGMALDIAATHLVVAEQGGRLLISKGLRVIGNDFANRLRVRVAPNKFWLEIDGDIPVSWVRA